MAQIWKARSSTPGDRNFVAGTLENLALAAFYKLNETRGDGVLGTYNPGGGGTPPTTPRITLTSTATTIVVTVDGEAGATNYALYKSLKDLDWRAGGNRSGDGTITITGLTTGQTYYVTLYSDNGVYSQPAPVLVTTLSASGDIGLMADIEAAIVTILSTIILDGNVVFKTVDKWKHQINAPDAFDRYAPFAFVKYGSTPNTGIEGDHDLNQHLHFALVIGTTSREDGGARLGTGTNAEKYQLGVSRLRDLVINALQEVVPTTSDGKCEYFEFISDAIEWEAPKQYALNMIFRIDRVSSY